MDNYPYGERFSTTFRVSIIGGGNPFNPFLAYRGEQQNTNRQQAALANISRPITAQRTMANAKHNINAEPAMQGSRIGLTVTGSQSFEVRDYCSQCTRHSSLSEVSGQWCCRLCAPHYKIAAESFVRISVKGCNGINAALEAVQAAQSPEWHVASEALRAIWREANPPEDNGQDDEDMFFTPCCHCGADSRGERDICGYCCDSCDEAANRAANRYEERMVRQECEERD
tara:strand:+ start:1522 stop:2205 length:684 start_codon:yes stop_codon:yes gene_type:complete